MHAMANDAAAIETFSPLKRENLSDEMVKTSIVSGTDKIGR